jgi:uncharacterized small protein (DUF1192 family)
MSNESSLSLPELNDRIAILQDNIRQLIEQAAGASGEQNESRIADRLSQQNEELERLTKERDSRSKRVDGATFAEAPCNDELGSPRPACGERSDRIARCVPGEGDSPRVRMR